MTKRANTATATTNDAAPTDSIAPLALRAPEAARALGISERALWTATNAGEVPHVRVGRTTLYPVDALRDWLAERAKKSVRRSARSEPE